MLKKILSALAAPAKEAAAIETAELIAEIHHEFNTAADKAVVAAQKIINDSTETKAKKGRRLQKFGFVQTREAQESLELDRLILQGHRELEAIKKHNMQFPLHKFILERQVVEICRKYNLVHGVVELFKGFVPEKNLLDIERFNDLLMKQQTLQMKPRPDQTSIDWLDPFMIDRRSGPRSQWDSQALMMMRQMQQQPAPSPRSGLSICAPAKDMDMRGMYVDANLKVQRHIPDPVVLHPVEHGYIIVTAWGEEASDPIVVNEKNN